MVSRPLTLFSHPSSHETGQLRLEAAFLQDRFHLKIGHAASEGKAILCSIVSDRGEQSTDWPASPPLQELIEQHGDDGRYLAGIGRAGASHWSVVILATHNGIEFDWACRVKTAPNWLGCTYQFNSTSSRGKDGGTTFDIEDRGSSVSVSPCDGTRITNAAAGVLQICPQSIEVSAFPFTFRWKYLVSFD